MERKTKKILRSLATRLVAEIGEVSSDQMKQAFKVAMDLLPDSLLKQDITTNDELYFDLLQSYVEDIEKKAGNTQEKSSFPETSIQFPYNLYVRKGYRFVHKRLKTVPFRHRPAILSHLVSKQLTTLNSDNLLRLMQQDEEGSSDGTLTKSIKQFKILSCGNRNPVALIKVMNIYFQRKLTEMENYTQKKKMKSITKSKKDLKKFLLLCHFRHENFNKQSNDAMNHEYNNLIAAFLSLYLEMCFVSSHKLVAEDVGKELCGLVSFLLYSSPQHQLDVLLQLDISVVEINSVLLPLARKCLQVKPEKNNCEHYLRFVLAINYMHLCLGDTIDDLKQECRKIRAPDNFLEWLENKNPEIFEEIPSYQKFRGKVITRFLLDEMDSSLQISLLDIFTAVGKPSHKEVQEMTAAENKLVPSAMENENGDIFFIDTGNKKPGNEEDNTKDPKVSDLEPYDLKSDADVIFLGMRKEESEKVKDSTTEDESVEGMEDQGSLVNRENSFEVQSEHVKDVDSDDDCVIITNEVAEKSAAAAAMEILEVEQSNYERMEIYKEMEVATNPWADCEEETGQDEEGLNMMDRNGYSGSSKSTDEDNSDDDLESGTLYIDIPEDLDKNSTSQNSSQKETDQGFTHIKDRNEIEDAVVEQNSLVEKELLPKMQIPTNTSAVIDIELISDSEDSDTELQFSKGLLPSIKKHLKSPGSAFLHKKLDWNNSSDSCQNCRVKLQSLTKSIDVQERVDVNEAGSSIASCMGNKERKFENSQDNSTPRQLTKIPPKMAGTEQSLVSDFQPKSSGNESLPEEAKTLQPKSSTTPALQTRLRSNHIQSVKPFKKSCVTLTQFKTRSTSKSRSESDIEPKMIMEQKNLKSSFNFPYSDDQNDLESRIPTLKKNSEQKKSVGSRNEKLDLVRKSEPHLRKRWQGMESSNVDHSNLVSEQAISTNSESDIHVHKEPVTLVDQVFGPKSTLKTYALRSKLSRDKSQSLKGSISSKMPISSSSDLSSRELSTMSSSVDSVGKGILCVFDEDDDSDVWFQTKSEGKNTSKELSVVKAFKDSDISGPDSRSMRTRSMDFGLESSASKQGETRKSVEVSGDAYGNFAKSLVSKRKYAPPLTTDSPKRPKTRSMHPSGAGEIFVKKISPENSAPVQDLLLKALPRRSLRKQVTKESSSTDLNSNGLQQPLKPVLQSSYSQGSNSLETKRITRSHLSSNEESRVGLRSLRQRSLRAEKN